MYTWKITRMASPPHSAEKGEFFQGWSILSGVLERGVLLRTPSKKICKKKWGVFVFKFLGLRGSLGVLGILGGLCFQDTRSLSHSKPSPVTSMPFLLTRVWRQYGTVFAAYWILIGQFKLGQITPFCLLFPRKCSSAKQGEGKKRDLTAIALLSKNVYVGG